MVKGEKISVVTNVQNWELAVLSLSEDDFYSLCATNLTSEVITTEHAPLFVGDSFSTALKTKSPSGFPVQSMNFRQESKTFVTIGIFSQVRLIHLRHTCE